MRYGALLFCYFCSFFQSSIIRIIVLMICCLRVNTESNYRRWSFEYFMHLVVIISILQVINSSSIKVDL